MVFLVWDLQVFNMPKRTPPPKHHFFTINQFKTLTTHKQYHVLPNKNTHLPKGWRSVMTEVMLSASTQYTLTVDLYLWKTISHTSFEHSLA